MKKTFFTLMLAGIVFSCSKQEIAAPSEPGNPEGITEVSAGLEATRTSLGALEAGKRKVYWSEGDQITINGTASRQLTGVQDQQASADFVFDAVLSYPYKAVYPATIWASASTVTLPAVQQWADGTFATNTAPAAGYLSDNGTLTLSNLCGVIKLKLLQKDGGDAHKIASVRFEGKASEQISGTLNIDYTTQALQAATAVADADKAVTVTMDCALSTSEPLEVYVVVPARTYASGISLTIIDENGHAMTTSVNSSVTIAKGQVVAPSEAIVFDPSATVVIGDVDAYTAFATAFKAGEYDGLGNKLTVNVTADLDFSGKTFVTVDDADHKFAGTWNGNGHLMKNITSVNTPMFFIPSGATLKDIVIDETCSFSKTASAGGNWGIIARALEPGVMVGCVVNCDWNIDYGSGGNTLGYGAIVGRTTGTVQNCNMNGDLIYTRAVDTKLTERLYIGGVVGYVYSATGLVEYCNMNGNLKFNEPAEANCPVCETADKYFCVGGVVGLNKTNATVRNCYMKGDVSYKDHVWDVFLGGVIGNNEGAIAEDCHLEGNFEVIQNYSTSTYKRLFAGGVLGRSTTKVNNCTTKAGKTLTVSSAVGTVEVGGIIGNLFNGTFTNCVNNMAVQQNTIASKNMNIGGVIGLVNSSVTAATIGAINNGAVSVASLSAESGSATRVGGVIGWALADVNGGTIVNKVSSIHNTAQVSTNAGEDGYGFGYACFGGVVGATNSNATNLTNAGKVYIDFSANKDDSKLMKYVAAGGVVGKLYADKTIEGCINNAVVQFRYWGTANQTARIEFVGGIVGNVIKNTNSGGLAATIKNCYNYGQINDSINNSSYPNLSSVGKCVGGIAGAVLGADGTRATVQGCTSSSSTAHASSVGYFGGLLGYAAYTDIINCTNTASIGGSAVGGIVAMASSTTVKSSTIENCTVTFNSQCGGVANGSNDAYNEFSGNFVRNVSFVNSTSSSKASAFGAIARNPIAATVVANNGISGSFKDGSSATAVAFSESYHPYTASGTFTGSTPNYVIGD